MTVVAARTSAVLPTVRTTAVRTPAAVVPRQRRPRADEHLPLGSLTQREHRGAGECLSCGGTRLTRLTMSLTDGGSVDFVSCHHCEFRRWESEGIDVPVAEVLARTAKR